jgi:hypothetical protein
VAASLKSSNSSIQPTSVRRQTEAGRKVFQLVALFPVVQLIEVDFDEIDLEVVASGRALARLGSLLASPLLELGGEPLECEPVEKGAYTEIIGQSSIEEVEVLQLLAILVLHHLLDEM